MTGLIKANGLLSVVADASEVLSLAKRIDGDKIYLEAADYTALWSKYQPDRSRATPLPVAQAVPYDRWPEKAKMVAYLSVEADAGVGDVLARYSNSDINGQRGFPLAVELAGRKMCAGNLWGFLNARYPLRQPA